MKKNLTGWFGLPLVQKVFLSVSLMVLLFPWGMARAQTVKISIYNDAPLKSVVVSSFRGTYHLMGDHGQLLGIVSNGPVYISLFNKRLLVRSAHKPIGLCTSVQFAACDSGGILKVSPIDPVLTARQYDDNLQISVAFGRLLLCNVIRVDKYIAGVVEAEGGAHAPEEFYKAQSVLARTYLFRHIDRHASEGFNLCDGVHCQAYHGRPHNHSILQLVKETSGVVALDSDSDYIIAVFHANCGGETQSARNAWLKGKSYLQPVKDPFCQNSPSSRWTCTIPTETWEGYLRQQGFSIPQNMPPIDLDFTQIDRKEFYRIGKDSIPVTQIRSEFKLRSTFFSVVANRRNVILKGKGFGHGVGLCQDGAMQMARIGYKYKDILRFYYKNILIVKKSMNEKDITVGLR